MHTRLSRRARSLAVATAALVAMTGAFALGSATPAHADASTGTDSVTFSDPATTSVWVVPPWVTSLHVHAVGGSGSAGRNFINGGKGGAGGKGGVVDADMSVTPGQAFTVRPGGAASFTARGRGMLNDGGRAGKTETGGALVDGSGHGGAASVVARSSDGTPLVVAGGGAGGGDAGSLVGANGGVGGDGVGSDGRAAALGGAGAGGRGSSGSNSGGNGGSVVALSGAGGAGGGGGGWIPAGTGGGAGGHQGTGAVVGTGGGGGAGGESYSSIQGATTTVATLTGDGSITFSWALIQTGGSVSASVTSAPLGTPVHFSAQFIWPSVQPASGQITFWIKDVATGSTRPLEYFDASFTASPTTASYLFPVGQQQVWVTYAGDTAHAAFTSSPVRFTITPQISGVKQLAFGFLSVGARTTGNVIYTNTSSLPWTIASINFSGGAFSFDGSGSCGPTLAPGASCRWSFTFAPTDTKFAGATVSFLDTFGYTTTIALTGRGVRTPAITGLTPSTGPISGGTVVTISGTNLIGITAIHFGSFVATKFGCALPTVCTVTTPRATAAQKLAVTVTNAAGTSAANPASGFTFG